MSRLGFGVIANPQKWLQVIMLTLTSLVSLACATRPQGVGSRVLEVFEDFTFVGASPDEAEAPVAGSQGGAIAGHGTAQLPLPQLQDVGVRYVFHHQLPVDNEKLALVELPKRLGMIGIRVVDSPKSRSDLAYPFVGGPVFEIRIADGDHEGRIYNQLDPSLLKVSEQEHVWAVDDYVLLWLK